MCIKKEDLEIDYLEKFRTEGAMRSIIESRARELLRVKELHNELPGFELLVTAIAVKIILEYEFEEDIYQMVERVLTVPTIYPVIKDINPVEQHLKEVLRAAGHKEAPIDFIEDSAELIQKQI